MGPGFRVGVLGLYINHIGIMYGACRFIGFRGWVSGKDNAYVINWVAVKELKLSYHNGYIE